MKRIKVITLSLALGVAGVVYAASSSHAQSTTQDKAESCCTVESCCTGGSCCAEKLAKQ